MDKGIYVANIQAKEIGRALNKEEKHQLKSLPLCFRAKYVLQGEKVVIGDNTQPKHLTYSKSHQ